MNFPGNLLKSGRKTGEKTWINILFLILPALLIVFLLAVIPLVRYSSSYNSFEIPKTVLIKSLLIALAGLAFIRISLGIEFRIPLNLSLLTISGFFLTQALTRFTAMSPSLWNDRISFLLAVFLFVIIFQEYVKKNIRFLFLLTSLLCISGALTSLWVVYEDFASVFAPDRVNIVSKLEDWRGYLVAGFGNTSHIGDFLALTFFISFIRTFFSVGKKYVIFFIVLTSVIFPGLIICWSVTSNFSLIIGMFIFLIMMIADRDERQFLKRRKLRIIIMFIIFILVSLFYILDTPGNPHSPGIFKQAFSSQRWKDGGPTRVAIWNTTIEMIKQNPVLGTGAGNFTYLYPQIHAPSVINNPELLQYAGAYTNAAHNEFLQTAAESGFIGLAAFIAMIGVFFFKTIKGIRNTFSPNRRIYQVSLVLMIMFILQSMMNFTLQIPYSTMFFFILLIIPEIADDRFRRGYVLFPVEYNFGVLKITPYLKNMELPPIAIGISLNGSVVFKTLCVILGAFLFSMMIFMTVLPLRSDIWYKTAKTRDMFSNKISVEEAYRIALSLNKNHSDCRSAYSSFLLKQGRYEESLNEVLITQERLKSNELYERLALIYHGMGNNEKYLENLLKYYDNFPINKKINQDKYLELVKKYNADKNGSDKPKEGQK